ncbi:MAG TPA: nucleotidyltransferase domain-containing protein [Thermoplasmata archaeon]|nr:nucleotidyltransferase domain-containing protein [Thermoplasmata archaeon]
MEANRKIFDNDFLKKIKKDEEVLAVLLFGSYVKGGRSSDIDVCIVLMPEGYENLSLSEKRLKYLSLVSNKIDIQIFQQLPLYVKINILKDGKEIFCRNEDLFYGLAFQTIKDFESFKKYYYGYLEEITHE